MDDAHAAQPGAVRQADELAQRLARFVAAQAVQVELALDAPAARAQLARYVLANAGAAKAQLIVHIQQGADVELIAHGFVQHPFLIQLMLQAARAEGKNEQLAEDRGSLLGKLVDKVTGGKEKQKAANTAERDAANQAAQQVDASLAQAQQMLDDVNAQLDHNGKLQEAAETVRTGAQDAYENHKDVIDRVGTYLIDGIRFAADKIL